MWPPAVEVYWWISLAFCPAGCVGSVTCVCVYLIGNHFFVRLPGEVCNYVCIYDICESEEAVLVCMCGCVYMCVFDWVRLCTCCLCVRVCVFKHVSLCVCAQACD